MMGLSRRAPREVYRVFSEAEFFERAAGEEPRAPTAAAVDHRLTLLGAMTLLAAVGMVGGLVAIAALTPAIRSARRTGGLLAATGSFAASRLHGAHLWRQPPVRPPSRSPSVWPTARALTDVVRRVPRARRTVVQRSHEVVVRDRTAPMLVVSPESSRVAVAERAPANVSAPAGPVASPSRGGSSEFRFER